MKSVLVTGSNGMLGSQVAKAFSNAGWLVTGVGRTKRPTSALVTTYHQGDLTNSAFIKQISQPSFDCIVHCAAIVNLKFCEDFPNEAEALHVCATEELVKLNSEATFLYISTDSVFDGETGNYSEDSATKTLNVYAKTKQQGEDVVRKHTKNYSICRTNIYGFSQPFGASLFEWAFQELRQGKEIGGYDNVIFNPLYVAQLAKLLLLIAKKKPASEIFHLGCSEAISKYEFLRRAAKKMELNSSLIQSSIADYKNSVIKRPENTSLKISKIEKEFPNFDFSLNYGLSLLKQDLIQANEYDSTGK